MPPTGGHFYGEPEWELKGRHQCVCWRNLVSCRHLIRILYTSVHIRIDVDGCALLIALVVFNKHLFRHLSIIWMNFFYNIEIMIP